ncbi:tyrosine-protein kinase, active site protein [Pochonia chlamydosporia 170]|uniref:non-specific serine/threonine protein kinase n=1 Tax=Pochonia chlamydosporia 170 TaxID=1380566 RepID=A0A179FRU0_METCM|nr:tyrosine-protein kinase, active site protein [Pochonia chlamydosporia 170]OAQ68345.1 tyrosine-protein kinase, active site protein [Pochonia chlamydosporia 170]
MATQDNHVVGIGAEPKLLGSFDLVWKYLGQLDESNKEAPSRPTVPHLGMESEGSILLYSTSDRNVTLRPDKTVIKSGKTISLEEAEALQVAAQAGLLVPRILTTDSQPGGINVLQMSHVDGQPLSEVWSTMTPRQKRCIALQLREILTNMRSLQAPTRLVGACSGGQFRDTRLCHSHYFPSLVNEDEFNRYLILSLSHVTPRPVRDAFARQQRNNHRIVFTHGDLSPRNIIVSNDRIVGIVDWEEAGWFPEYWEYVKFFLRTGAEDGDWPSYAYDIFPDAYHDQLVLYFSILQWQSP